MRKRTFLLAALSAGLILSAAGAAWAGEPIPNIIVASGCKDLPGDPCPHKSGRIDTVTVTLNLTKPETWAYDPVKGTRLPAEPEPAEAQPVDMGALNAPVAGPAPGAFVRNDRPAMVKPGTAEPPPPAEPQPAEVINPVPGIGVVVRKNPGAGSGAFRLEPNKTGGYDLPPLENGLYDLVVTIPMESLKVKSPYKGVNLTFTLVKTDDGIFDFVVPPGQGDNNKGSGSPKNAGF